MDVLELYERYNKVYEIELREVATPYHLHLMKEIGMFYLDLGKKLDL